MPEQTPLPIRPISPQRYDLLAGMSRHPHAGSFMEEVAWFEAAGLVATLVIDGTDRDYNVVISARGETGRYEAIDWRCSFDSGKEALKWMEQRMRALAAGLVDALPAAGGVDPFEVVAPTGNLHPSFLALSRQRGYHSARAAIRCVMQHFDDVDGNFLEQFQSAGFDARLWELYLFVTLREAGLLVERPDPSPEFLVSDGVDRVAIEAVTAGRSDDNPASFHLNDAIKVPPLKSPADPAVLRQCLTRLGRPLRKKLRKRYWELLPAPSIPLVLAVADFHEDRSMLWSHPVMIELLYGYRHSHRFDGGHLVVLPERSAPDPDGRPAGIFNLPDAEKIAAVMTTTGGTLAKFSRIGRQAGFAVDGVHTFRSGAAYDHDPDAAVPTLFSYMVDETCCETWSEGLSIFHNPHAEHPLPPDFMPHVAHLRLRPDGQVESEMPPFHPYSSETVHLNFMPKRSGL